MSYTKKDLEPLVRGDDWTIKLSITSGGSDVDITGYRYTMTLKSNIDATDPGDAQSTTGVLGNTADSQAGIVYLNFTNAQTSVLEAQTYNYDIQQIDGTGAVQTLFIGRVKVDKDVTLTIA